MTHFIYRTKNLNLKNKILYIISICLLIPSFSIAEIKQKSSDIDLRKFINSELKSGKKKIIIPAGRYYVKPVNGVHLLFKYLEGVTIFAEGAELICTETTRAITIQNCINFTIKGLTVDYDPLPFTQGKIVNISENGLIHEVEISEGYPTSGKITGFKYEIFNAETRTLRFGSYYGCEVQQLSSHKLQITKPAHYKNKHPEQIGDIIVTTCENAPNRNIPHAIYLNNSEAVTLENINLYASNCFGFFEDKCSRSIYRRCNVNRRDLKTDLKHRANPRIRSLNADAFHSKHAEIGPSYIQCHAKFQGDDCVAISSNYHLVMNAKGKTLRVLSKQSFNILPGDSVELFSYDGLRLPDAKVISVNNIGSIKPIEEAFIAKQRMNENIKTNRRSFLNKAYQVIIDRPVNLPIGSLISSSNRMGNGFKIIDCDFGFNRSRGILVKASNGVIRGNKLEGCWMESIKLSPEYWWLEAGHSSDVQIHDNVIKNTFHRAISIESKGGDGKTSPAGAHRNISIDKNLIENTPVPQIKVTSTENIVITNNSIVPSEQKQLGIEDSIKTFQCTISSIKNNRILDSAPNN